MAGAVVDGEHAPCTSGSCSSVAVAVPAAHRPRGSRRASTRSPRFTSCGRRLPVQAKPARSIVTGQSRRRAAWIAPAPASTPVTTAGTMSPVAHRAVPARERNVSTCALPSRRCEPGRGSRAACRCAAARRRARVGRLLQPQVERSSAPRGRSRRAASRRTCASRSLRTSSTKYGATEAARRRLARHDDRRAGAAPRPPPR
jgi:hypothetical protein